MLRTEGGRLNEACAGDENTTITPDDASYSLSGGEPSTGALATKMLSSDAMKRLYKDWRSCRLPAATDERPLHEIDGLC